MNKKKTYMPPAAVMITTTRAMLLSASASRSTVIDDQNDQKQHTGPGIDDHPVNPDDPGIEFSKRYAWDDDDETWDKW